MYCGLGVIAFLYYPMRPQTEYQSRDSILRDQNDNCVNSNAVAYYRNMPNRIGLFPCASGYPFHHQAVLPLVAEQQSIPVKVVVVAMFEVAGDTGDAPRRAAILGRARSPRSGLPSARRLPRRSHERGRRDGGAHRAGHRPRRRHHHGARPRPPFRPQPCVLADRRNRRRKPRAHSLGSAAWARWVVDGDLGYEIDCREMPQDWSTGYIPLRKTHPFESPPLLPTARSASSTLISFSGHATSPAPPRSRTQIG